MIRGVATFAWCWRQRLAIGVLLTLIFSMFLESIAWAFYHLYHVTDLFPVYTVYSGLRLTAYWVESASGSSLWCALAAALLCWPWSQLFKRRALSSSEKV